MKKIERKDVKTAAKFVVGMSVSYVVGNVLKNNTTADKSYQKVEVVIGSTVLGMIAANAAEDFTSKKIDEIADGWTKAKAEASKK